MKPYPESNATWFSCELWNNNQSKEYECAVEYPLSYFNVLM